MSPAPAPSASQLPMAKDFSKFLSLEGATRKKSPLKSLIPLMYGDMLSLGGGLPHPSTFPFHSLSAQITGMRPAAGETHQQKTKTGSSDLVTVPLAPHPDKVESLTASLQYGIGTGIKSLRDFCREHVRSMHQPQYQDWDVILSAGNTDAFSKVIGLLCNRGDKIFVEEWTYPTALETLDPLGVGHIAVEMDGEGMTATGLRRLLDNWGSTPEQANEAKPRVVYLIPTGQNPTGTTMSVKRRMDILSVAQDHDLILIEDDPYYYLQFHAEGGSWMPSLLSMDTDGRVIRLDTFSKTLAPGCRVGYMSMNTRFCDIMQYHNEVTIQQPSGFAQAILAEMLVSHWGQEGYTRYLTENVRTEYLKRSQHLQTALKSHLNPKQASFIEPSAGMFIWIKIHLDQHPRYKTVKDSALMLELFQKCIENKVLMVPGWQFSCKPKPQDDANYLRATFAYASFEQMDEASARFGRTVGQFFSA
ncbi:amino transferase [Linnemannia elongata AG-77]|uniref:Amino transferase n=1 Tax=Linnemannia elongata AG-77 TaxID=1314771 RepID=A0A197KEL2_9FUNG|nr:amino transferase [Linnemannia elongata AG-77]